MSDNTTTHTSGTCDLVLDYVYGELDEAGKRAFEEHLPTCTRCQAEVKSFGRVRAAVKRVMPSVEPSAALGSGALHAQLMHAAAQRKPRRGVLLAFPRRVMQHPALSAAAMFVLVGGAFAINWSRGKMAMPANDRSAATAPAVAAPAGTTTLDAPKPTEEVAGKLAASPPKAEPMPSPKAKEQNEYYANKSGVKGGETALAKDEDGAAGGDRGGDKTKLALETPSGPMTVQRSAAHRAAPEKTAAPPRMKNIASDGKFAKQDSASFDDLASASGAKERKVAEHGKSASGKSAVANNAGGDSLGSLSGAGGVEGGVTGGGGYGRGALADNVKSSAPQEIARNGVVEKAPARDAQAVAPKASATRGYAEREEAPAPPPASPQTAPAQMQMEQRQAPAAAAAPATTSAVQKPAATARSWDALRKQALEDAKSGRCDEAIKRYTELDNAKQYISPTERVSWVRCLSQRGRQEEAQHRLDELKQEKRVTGAQIQDAEKELNDSRRRAPEAKKASKKAAPADRAPVSTESTSQQRRVDDQAPAQSPPDSTNTKIQKPTQAY